MPQLIINAKNTEKRIAVTHNKQLVDFQLFRPSQNAQVGHIFLAQIEKIDKKLDAAFLNLGFEKGFLHLKDLPEYVAATQGARLLVQVVRMGSKTKLPLVTGIVEVSNSYLVYMKGKSYVSVSKRITENEKTRLRDTVTNILKPEEAVIIRSDAENLAEAELFSHLEELRGEFALLEQKAAKQKRPGLIHASEDLFFEKITRFIEAYQVKEVFSDVSFPFATKLVADDDIFDTFKLSGSLVKLLQPIVHLKNGSSLFIEKTEAMWVIDVNSGSFSGDFTKEKTVSKVNFEAIPEILRQMRLRQISGFIVIDFIGGMSDVDHAKLLEEMERLVREELVTTQVAGFSKTGLMQLTRRKKEASLLEITSDVCPSCKGIGHVKSANSLAYELERELKTYNLSSLNFILIITTEAVLSAFLDLGVLADAPIDWEIADETVSFYQIARVE
ncbi:MULTISPECIES: ribonuclease E/G [unclassified Listeria]|uniref:ribonuclease E/G n=1 Tax=unclassified Listeria TaxID=2642072 RepID=UPI000B593067|nr:MULTISPECIES: ribonuclease E/G [unclassified Listeria]